MSLKYTLAALLLASAFPADASAAHHVIEIKDMAFSPVPKNLKVGDTVEWKNSDIFRHTATAWMGSFDLDLIPGAHAQVTLRKPGTLNVYCRFHPTMVVRLSVLKR